MLRFFRNIRQQGLTRNKASKYLLYALGEILLVVIGILIALSIDNWNTDHQLKKTERKYLGEIRDNLTFDLRDIRFNINFNEDKLNSNEIILNYLKAETPYSDTLEFHFSNLLYSTRTLPNASSYEALKSKGLDIITNDSLRQLITTLYDFAYKNAIDFETKDDHPQQFHVLWPEVIKAIDMVVVWREAKPIDQNSLLKNYPLKNAITANIFIRKYMLDTYKKLLKRVEETIKAIDKELGK